MNAIFLHHLDIHPTRILVQKTVQIRIMEARTLTEFDINAPVTRTMVNTQQLKFDIVHLLIIIYTTASGLVLALLSP